MKPFSTSVLKQNNKLEYLLLPPRSALKAVPHAVARIQLPNNLHASSYLTTPHYVRVASRVSEISLRGTWAPSILGADSFGKWVVTHSLADSDFRGHRLAVCMNRRPFLGSGWVSPLGSLTRVRLVHPTSPVLLTRCGPLVTCNIKKINRLCLDKAVIGYHLKVWE